MLLPVYKKSKNQAVGNLAKHFFLILQHGPYVRSSPYGIKYSKVACPPICGIIFLKKYKYLRFCIVVKYFFHGIKHLVRNMKSVITCNYN